MFATGRPSVKISTENSIRGGYPVCRSVKAVGESVREPIMYYDNNLISTSGFA